MRSVRPDSVRSHSRAGGFTLIELLVVMAIISLLLAMTLPVSHRVRTLAHRMACSSRLHDIAIGWHTYLNDNDQRFYQEVNANHDFGGWKGTAGGRPHRLLNKYVGLPAEPNGPGRTTLFRCLADQGDQDYGPQAYMYFGNSYQTNLMLIGPDSLPTGLPEPIRGLNRKINMHLKGLKADAVFDPTRLVLLGDNNWITQWDPLIPAPGRAWHGREGCYNLAFLDSHIDFVGVGKAVYIGDDYRIQPFKDLDDITHEVQNTLAPPAQGAD